MLRRTISKGAPPPPGSRRPALGGRPSVGGRGGSPAATYSSRSRGSTRSPMPRTSPGGSSDARHEHHLLDPDARVALHLREEGVDVVERVGHREDRALDLGRVAALVSQWPASTSSLCATSSGRRGRGCRRRRSCATSRSVLRSPLPPMRICGPRRLDRRRAADRLVEPVVLALVRPVVVAPHLEADLHRLLQPLEALADRRERHAEPEVLALVPRRADAELGPAAGEHVERGHRLGQQPRVAVGHAGDEEAERRCRSVWPATKPSAV